MASDRRKAIKAKRKVDEANARKARLALLQTRWNQEQAVELLYKKRGFTTLTEAQAAVAAAAAARR